MTTTSQSVITAVEYVLADVLGETKTVGSLEIGPYRATMIAAGVTNINDFLILENDDLKELEVEIVTVVTTTEVKREPASPVTRSTSSTKKAPAPTINKITRRLTPVERRTLLRLQMWYADFGLRNPAITPVSRWFQLTRRTFGEWNSTYRGPSVPPVPTGGGTGNPVIQGGLATPQAAASDPKESADLKLLESFTKGIKRDENAYKVFKEDQYWLSWRRSLLVTANSQNVARVFDLDLDRSLLTGSDRELYDLQLSFGYSVLTRVVQTNQGRGYVRDHAHDNDATAVFAEMTEYYTTSRAAEIAASELEVKITNLKFDSKWTTGAVAFLNYWKTLIFDLDEIRGDADPIKINQKKEWLIRALSENQEMAAAVTSWNTTDRMMAESLSAMGKPPRSDTMVYASIMTHLLTTATNYDKKHTVARSSRRQAFKTEKKTIVSSRYIPDAWYIEPAKWNAMSPAEKTAHTNKRRAAKNLHKGKKSYNQVRKDQINAAVQEALKAEREANKAVVSSIPVIEVNTSSTAPSQASISTATQSQSPTLKSILACSNNSTRQSEGILSDSKVTNINNSIVTDASGHMYLKLSKAERTYHVSNAGRETTKQGSLVDRGANGGLGGKDMRVIEVVTTAKCDVTGIMDNAVTNLDIVLGAGLLKSNRGPVIGLFPQYAYLGQGKTIHSCAQMEDWGILVDEKPRKSKFPGKQRIETPDGYAFPIAIRNGLPYLDMSYPTEEDMDNFPHVYMTRDEEWDPTVMDDEYEEFVDEMGDYGDDLAYTSPVNNYGEIGDDRESEIDVLYLDINKAHISNKSEAVEVNKQIPKYDKLRPNFLWVSADRIKKTLAATTQFARSIGRIPFRKHFKTRWPAANVNRLNDDVATDTFFRTPQL
jgi:hypothetical protein